MLEKMFSEKKISEDVQYRILEELGNLFLGCTEMVTKSLVSG
jgi:hypothetical protein